MRKLLLLTILITVTLLTVVPADAQKRCDICNQEIDGMYYTFETHGSSMTVCSDCYENLARCEMCGIPVPHTRAGQTGVLCRTCRLKAHKCSVCGTELYGRYYTDQQHHYYCSDCYAKAERCPVCNDILRPGEWRLDHGTKICLRCLREQPRCHACGSIVIGPYSTFKGFDGFYCQHCIDHTPACISCLRPCGPHPIRLPNGHAVCRDCASTALRTKHQLEGIVAEVAAYMEKNLLMEVKTPVLFKLVDVVDYDSYSDKYRESGRFIQVNDDFTIKILTGLSRPLSIETVAHELAHAWQAENCPHLPSDDYVEGFAQWVAGQVLRGFGYHKLVERLGYRNDVYGRGFRKITEIEEKQGFSAVFQEMIRIGNPPK